MSYKKLSILIVLVSLVLAVTSLWDDSFVVDEIPHVGAGYSYITKGDFRLNPEHPPLAKDIAGLALSFLSINQTAFSTQYWTTDINGQWNFGRALIYNPANNVDALTRTAKTTMLIFFVLSAVLIYRWANERYNAKAAFLATLLFSFSPTVLAHSRFVTTDMPALFGVLLGTYFFTKFLQKPDQSRFWLAVFAFGLAQLTKFSLVLIAPLFVLMIITWGLANSFSFRPFVVLFIRSLVLMAVGIIIVIWPVYALHVMNYPPERQKNDTESNLASYSNRLFADPVVWASDKPIIRPLAYYATGILMVNQRSIGGNTTFFLGEVRNYAWKHYFPVVYAIKESLAFWLLTIMVLLFLAAKVKLPHPVDNRLPMSVIHRVNSWVKNWIRNYFVEFSMLLWIAMYWYLSINTNLNIGVRHLLPTYGFVFILLAGQLSKFISSKTGTKLAIANFVPVLLLLGWYVYETVSVHPHYLTYFNQLAGGPAGGHQYIVDSNLDWGQDLKRLAMWVEDPVRGKTPAEGGSSADHAFQAGRTPNGIDKIHLDYFGWADQSYYLKNKFAWINAGTYKNARDFFAQNPDGGYIAVSVSFYMGSRGDPVNNYIWLDSYEPVAKIGNSIWVWHLVP